MDNQSNLHTLILGDGPASQFEAGQQKGGDYFCWACPVSGESTNSLSYCYYQKCISFEERRDKILQSLRSQNATRNNNLKLYSNLKKDAICQELQERGVKYL